MLNLYRPDVIKILGVVSELKNVRPPHPYALILSNVCKTNVVTNRRWTIYGNLCLQMA